ncbi:hypothetical protein DdX_19547 [Ditylenchus destructor]|uniref:Uncharacterized protein n=1 Tax=Ditylenchus destructor TaxID=166010 RepID=A0AAD4MMZ7_9BILA|nr:hypothetical protein DdX_19547 [Ditylenchus destructor]
MFNSRPKVHRSTEDLRIAKELRETVLSATNQNLENFRWNETVKRENELKCKSETGNVDIPSISFENDCGSRFSRREEREYQLKMKELDHKHEEEMMKLNGRVADIDFYGKRERFAMPKTTCCGLFLKKPKSEKKKKEKIEVINKYQYDETK